jgi:small-conductance mechanosensitive channel
MSTATWSRPLVAAILAAAFSWTSPLHAQDTTTVDYDGDVAVAPVELDGSALFTVRGVSSLPAAERARVIQERLVSIASDPAISIDSLHLVELDNATRIMAADRLIMTIANADASVEQVTIRELAATHMARVRDAIVGYRAARSPAALRASALNAATATVVLLAACIALSWFWRWFDRLVTLRLSTRIQTVGIQSFEVMRADRIWSAVRSGLLALRTVILLALVLAYTGFVLAQFPRTRGMSRGMAALALGPLQVIANGFLANIPSLVFITILFFVVRVSLRLIRLFFDAIERRTVTLANFDPEWAQPTYKIVRTLVIAFGLVVAYPYIPGSESAAFRGVSLFIGIVFSLGSSSAISNIIAGYMMTYRRAFKVGDWVKVGGSVGEVIEMRLQVTHLRSTKNEEIVIPNSQILTSEVLNYSSLARTRGLILHTEVGIGYETPWRQVEAMLTQAAKRTPGLVMEPPPFVLQRKLADFAVVYELNVYCSNVPAFQQLYSALHRNILDVFNEYGVQIMTPAYERDPLEPKIVRREDWFAAPAQSAESASQPT